MKTPKDNNFKLMKWQLFILSIYFFKSRKKEVCIPGFCVFKKLSITGFSLSNENDLIFKKNHSILECLVMEIL